MLCEPHAQRFAYVLVLYSRSLEYSRFKRQLSVWSTRTFHQKVEKSKYPVYAFLIVKMRIVYHDAAHLAVIVNLISAAGSPGKGASRRVSRLVGGVDYSTLQLTAAYHNLYITEAGSNLANCLKIL
mgnify:CR=1